MKKTILVITVASILGILGGCAGNAALIKTMSTSTSQKVFQKIEANQPPVPGLVDLSIYSTLKTHKPGIYSSTDVHGTGEHLMLVNIDGQATTLKGRMSEERSEARSMRDPEEGDGVKYQFTGKLRVKAGVHRVVVAFPEDDLIAEREVNLSEGEDNTLIVEPIYGSNPGMQRPGSYSATSFMQGIKSLRLLFSGKTL
jgi:hypothetical protein